MQTAPWHLAVELSAEEPALNRDIPWPTHLVLLWHWYHGRLSEPFQPESAKLHPALPPAPIPLAELRVLMENTNWSGLALPGKIHIRRRPQSSAAPLALPNPERQGE
jgi:hypothetical protein